MGICYIVNNDTYVTVSPTFMGKEGGSKLVPPLPTNTVWITPAAKKNNYQSGLRKRS